MRKLKDEQKRNEVSAQGHGGPADLESGALDAEAAHPVPPVPHGFSIHAPHLRPVLIAA